MVFVLPPRELIVAAATALLPVAVASVDDVLALFRGEFITPCARFDLIPDGVREFAKPGDMADIVPVIYPRVAVDVKATF